MVKHTTKAQVKPNKAVAAKKIVKDKFKVQTIKNEDYVSCHQYMRVERIQGDNIHLLNDQGEKVEIDKAVLVQDSYSADHFDKQVTCNMTELSEVLQGAKDTIFTVEFKKKVDDKQIFDSLSGLKYADTKKPEQLKSIAKTILEGKQCTLIGHLVKSEQQMGRTLVIDCQAPADNRFRQVDHRTIQSIILRGVKYNLGKKSTLSQESGKSFSSITQKWEPKKLSVGNWFSEMQYYNIIREESHDHYECRIHNENKEIY